MRGISERGIAMSVKIEMDMPVGCVSCLLS